MNVRNVLFRRNAPRSARGRITVMIVSGSGSITGSSKFADYQTFFNAMPSSILYHFFCRKLFVFSLMCEMLEFNVMLYTWRILFLLVLHMLIASD